MLKELNNYWRHINMFWKEEFSLEGEILKKLGYPRPKSATMEDWEKWKKEYQILFPPLFSFFEFTRSIGTFFYKLNRRIKDFFYILRYVFIENYYTVRIDNSKYSKYSYHDSDELLLYSNFQILVDFVEIELASMQQICFKEDRGLKYFLKGIWVLGIFLKSQRNSELGLKYLNSKNIGDKEIKELYLWWTKIRFKRKSPIDISGWTKVCNDERKGKFVTKKEKRKALSLCRRIEIQHEKEDRNMLVKLIDFRGRLWT